MKTVYEYDHETKLYIPEATREANKDPKEGHSVLPANCTFDAPPPPKEDFTIVFDAAANTWTQIIDLRDTVYWLADGTQHMITEMGVAKPANALDAPPPPTTDELMRLLRTKRDVLLRNSDRNVLPDYPHANDTIKQSWLDYRQALRDLPSNTEDPNNPSWPIPPTL